MDPRAVAFGIVCALTLTGCATLDNLAGDQIPYGGFSDDITGRNVCPPNICGISTMISVIDTPFSFVGDTVTLPITVCAATGRSIAAWQSEAAERERLRPVTKLPTQTEPDAQDGPPTP